MMPVWLSSRPRARSKSPPAEPSCKARPPAHSTTTASTLSRLPLSVPFPASLLALPVPPHFTEYLKRGDGGARGPPASPEIPQTPVPRDIARARGCAERYSETPSEWGLGAPGGAGPKRRGSRRASRASNRRPNTELQTCLKLLVIRMILYAGPESLGSRSASRV